MEKILFKLNDFCCTNKIEYMVTGTTALYLLGVPSDFAPGDIDIKIFHVNDEQKKKLLELQFLSGLKNDNYKDTCYSFYIEGVKINALVDNTQDYDAIFNMSVGVNLEDEKQAKHHLISVQKVGLAIKDKMLLNREKDKKYLLNLIKNLATLA